MSQVEKLRVKLLEKLAELFQLNQPDLDFGFYRIMHAKAAEVQQFIEHDLLASIHQAFGDTPDDYLAELRGKYEAALQHAKEYGVAEPETAKPVMEAKAAYENARDSGSNEAQIYEHLYRFFERYYDDGDFVSLRYYSRETEGRAAPYAIPYAGEEVKLHWANADQYYIKTAEYFNNYSFDLRKAQGIEPTISSKQAGLDFDGGDEQTPLRVHFQIVEASEGEHGNIKADDKQKREFFLHENQPVALNQAGELVVSFEYRVAKATDTLSKELENQVKQQFDARSANKGDLPNLVIASQILECARNLEGLQADYINLLQAPVPTEKIKQRPLLARYLNEYTSRNTMDYFIHKDLGGFLRRELDFYIKNEVMRLDDIENADAPAVESYLGKIKVLRNIASKLIDFLAQLEDFQKKLWLKKKFVVETNYCISLDRVPAELYPQICANTAQLNEWVELFAIDEIKGDLTSPAFSRPLTEEFLSANQNLLIDTRFFDEAFKAILLASIDNLDEQCDGLLIHSENFQALGLIQERYKKQIKCVYIDPPYNTSASEIIYKNGYKNSSWLSLLNSRLSRTVELMNDKAIMCATIDDFEFHRLRSLMERNLGKENILGVIAIKNNPAGRSTGKGFSIAHEYAIFASKNDGTQIGRLPHTQAQLSRYKHKDEIGNFEWVNFRKHGGANANRYARPKLFYPIAITESNVRFPEIIWNEKNKKWDLLEEVKSGEKIIYPITPDGEEKTWKWGVETARSNPEEFCVRRDQTGEFGVYRKARLNDTGTLPLTVWDRREYSSTEYGTNMLKRIFGESDRFSFPKSLHAVSDSLRVCDATSDSIVLDYFAGSGTTGHAVITLNREDSGRRKYILNEMGNHFDSVLKPRIFKACYADDWRGGKPVSRSSGVSQCIKYIRLESYEDTLNNLSFSHEPARQRSLQSNDLLRQDYMLNYMLDVETRGSQSLLNAEAFSEPTAYTLNVKKPGSDESEERTVDLLETFNYLIGLRVEHIEAPERFSASFKREPDPHAPDDQVTKLQLDGRLKQQADGAWWLRKVEGWVPSDPANPNNGEQDRVLIVWRNLTGDLEQDNLILDEWFKSLRINSRDFEYSVIYVNGSNNLPNLKQAEDQWKVRLIEQEFHQRMWDV